MKEKVPVPEIVEVPAEFFSVAVRVIVEFTGEVTDGEPPTEIARTELVAVVAALAVTVTFRVVPDVLLVEKLESPR